MKNNKNDNAVKNNSRVNAAVDAYKKVASPLGSYTGLTDDMVVMPRRKIDGKSYMRVENPPKQDEDEL